MTSMGFSSTALELPRRRCALMALYFIRPTVCCGGRIRHYAAIRHRLAALLVIQFCALAYPFGRAAGVADLRRPHTSVKADICGILGMIRLSRRYPWWRWLGPFQRSRKISAPRRPAVYLLFTASRP
ncbi:hypothetical protein KCP75_22380 [Salmonella enterica subsp. enterica]|nr:hypothetical protein KCP75_22380 [Salmonella enterica subsp. enterica]